uniref:Uncharacterized protein n=1 Tax=Arundo donax TaxID=35708 RepID=A0A0A9GGM4_ARUDO
MLCCIMDGFARSEQHFLTSRFRNRKERALTIVITHAHWTEIRSKGIQKAPAILLAYTCLNLSNLEEKGIQKSSFTSSHMIGDPHSKKPIIHYKSVNPTWKRVVRICFAVSGPELSAKMPVSCSRSRYTPLVDRSLLTMRPLSPSSQ